MGFDEKNIVLSFASISDVHITGDKNDDSESKFRNAIKFIYDISRENGHEIDTFLISGDLINRSCDEPEKQVEAFRNIYDSLSEKPIIYSLGDGHDLYWGGENEQKMIKLFKDTLGEKNFVFDLDKDSIEKGNRHAVINGYHFITLMPCHRGPIEYSAETKAWFRASLEKAAEDSVGRYIFVSTHPMIYDTCYGSTLGNIWDTEDLTDILSEYPNVVVFGGHLHFPLNDERSIMQTDFTSVGCGAVRYMAIEDAEYENMVGKTVMRDSWRFSQGLLCELDKNGALRITRIDFYNKSKIKEPWTLLPPSDDRSHLLSYRKDRAKESKAPYFAENFSSDVNFFDAEGGKKISLSFSAACAEDMVHHYIINISSKDSGEKEYRVLADFYRHPYPADMAKTVLLVPQNIFRIGEKICVKIRAVGSFGKESEVKSSYFVVK